MRARLRVLKGSSEGKEIKLPGATFSVGRGDDCDLRPKSDAISRRHCELSERDGEIWIQDLGSKNGTLVNGERISGPRQLHGGETLKIGKLEFELVMSESAPVADDAETIRSSSQTVVGTEASAIPTEVPTETRVQEASTRVLNQNDLLPPGGKPTKSSGAPTGAEASPAKPPGGPAPAKRATGSESWSDSDIAMWLETGDDKSSGRADLETRQFRLDDTQRDLKGVPAEATEDATAEADSASASGEGAAEGKDDESKKDDTSGFFLGKKKQKPGKLPPLPKNTATSSKAAAEETLKRLFNNRP